ncbi:MAG: MBL fold metallo-hydrolase [Bryobacteraceae bacterium]
MLDQFERASILVLGSGTSVGVPMIGCHCKVCCSTDSRDKRLRPSILVRLGEHRILIDAAPDLRYQALRHCIERVDAILFTHAHADHVLGLDDIRPFNYMQKGEIPIYGSTDTLHAIEHIFSYVFAAGPTQSTRPRLVPRNFETGQINLFGVEFEPIPVFHGKGQVHGFRFGDCAYLTDHNDIPEESLERLKGLDVLFLDALRHNPHPTHSTVQQSLKTVELLQPKRTYFTHISHDLMHATVEAQMPSHVRIAFDGLEIPIGRSDRA